MRVAPGRLPKSVPGSSSRQKPVSTTTWRRRAQRLDQVLHGPGPHLDPPVGAGQPGHHREVRAERARARVDSRSASRPADASRAADSSPDTSSSTPRCWADRAAVGVGVDQHGPEPARGQRAGQPRGHGGPARGALRSPDHDHPAALDRRPARRRSGSAPAVRAPRRRPRAATASPRRVELGARRPAPRCRSGAPAAGPGRRSAVPPATTATGRTRCRRRCSTAAASRPGASRATTATWACPARRDGQQVVDVDAPLEDDHAGPLAEQPQGRGLPGGAGRDHQHADHDRVGSAASDDGQGPGGRRGDDAGERRRPPPRGRPAPAAGRRWSRGSPTARGAAVTTTSPSRSTAGRRASASSLT